MLQPIYNPLCLCESCGSSCSLVAELGVDFITSLSILYNSVNHYSFFYLWLKSLDFVFCHFEYNCSHLQTVSINRKWCSSIAKWFVSPNVKLLWSQFKNVGFRIKLNFREMFGNGTNAWFISFSPLDSLAAEECSVSFLRYPNETKSAKSVFRRYSFFFCCWKATQLWL